LDGAGAPPLSLRADDKFRRGAEGMRLTSVVEQTGHATSPRDNCDSNSSVEANQPSKRCSWEHFKSRTFMLIGASVEFIAKLRFVNDRSKTLLR